MIFKKGKLIVILFAMIILSILGVEISSDSSVYASAKATGISAFPASYQVYLKQLEKIHPNWTFTALNTDINWYTALQNEGPKVNLKRSAIPLSFAEVWKWKNDKGNYNVIEKGWVTASEAAIAYAMDPRLYLNEMQIFQFETLNYDSSTQNQDGVEKIFYGTLMHNSKITYTDTTGKKQTIDKTYSQVIMEAASKYGVSPYHLASRIKQETGCDITNNTSIKGTVEGYVGLYNYYNIGATGGDSPAISGLAYARTQNWTTPELAIIGGAKFLAESYISAGQYTTYLQKFNVDDESDYALYTHQYMQNILAPASESVSTYQAYLKMGLLEIPFNFVIPVYVNMPDIPADIYAQNKEDFEVDSTKVYTTVNLNVRSGPGTDNSALLTVPKGTVMTRIAKGVQAGERWDKVKLDTGLEGYVFQEYVCEKVYNKVSGVTLNNTTLELGLEETYSLIATIAPENATYKEVYWFSSDNNIVTISDTGVVTGLKEGTATITVTTDDQLKTATCNVTVIKKQPSISLDKSLYNILKDESSEIKVEIKNSDVTEYDVLIEDENIAKYEEGKIVALAEGTTKITVSIKGTEIKAASDIKVVEVTDEIKVDESLALEENIITKIQPGTKIQELKNKIYTSHIVSIVDSEGKELLDDAFVTTGTKVQVKSAEEESVAEYTVIIYGDVTLDGKINSGDLLAIVKHLNETNVFDKQFVLDAADVTFDKNINSGDLLKIVKYLNGNATLDK